MPIYFVSVLNQRQKIVLEAKYEKQQFKKQVEDSIKRIKCEPYNTATYKFDK